MDYDKAFIRNLLLKSIEDHCLPYSKEIELLKELDKTFRQDLGPFYLTDVELEKRDILFRSI